MIQLKTLKDIEWKDISGNGFLVQPKQLRQVAREWVNELRGSFPKVPNECGDDINITCNEKIALIYWLKHFFNLEEDK